MSEKYLILPDIHLRHKKAEKIISSVKPNKIIFLGDYLDDFNDTPEMVNETAEWLHWSVNQKNRVHLAGNHCVHYWFKDNKSLRCSGYEDYKSVAINNRVTKEDWEKLVFYYDLDNKWLLTHAGYHPSWIDRSKFNANEILQYSHEAACRKLKIESVEAKKAFYANKMHWFNMPGYSRSRNSPYYGGITWCDWDKEFNVVKGLNQIVGHTPIRGELYWLFVREDHIHPESAPWDKVCPELSNKTSYNICLDSEPGSKYYAVYEDGKLSIYNADKEIK